MQLSIIIPCLNEAETLALCIQKAKQFLFKNNIEGEIIVSDNGSTDGSQQIALVNGAIVENAPNKGYGNALKNGIKHAKGKYLIMGDADDSYDFSNLNAFLDKLKNGADLVMGNRFKGGIKPGAMPFLHRYLGNPVLSFIGKLFFKVSIVDFHCGLRGFSKEAALKMNLQSSGMEFASEMVVKAALLKMKIEEVPTILFKDGRSRPPHLRTWRDGWRHLRFLLIYSPIWLFYYPGLLLIFVGLISSILLFSGPFYIQNIGFDIHTLIYTLSFVMIGFQSISFYFFSKIYAIQNNFLPNDKQINVILKHLTLEKGLFFGIPLLIFGFIIGIFSFITWKDSNFGSLAQKLMVKNVIISAFSLILGFQIIIYSFFYSIMRINKS
ncbi:MAG: glycosyltransferase [Cytophagales bacterium]|nr:MAG: glycosyltransferase [Cytophagales bacterium]